MSDHFESFDLILQKDLGRVIVDSFEIDMFDSNLTMRSAIFSLVDLASGSLAKQFLRKEVVVADSNKVALRMVVFFLHFLINWNYMF